MTAVPEMCIRDRAMAGQIQGGVAMSVGYAFGENCQFKEGRLLNDSTVSYTHLDVYKRQDCKEAEGDGG